MAKSSLKMTYTMSNKRLVTIAMVVLILSNAALLIFLINGKKHHNAEDRNHDPKEWIVSSLEFDTQQERAYEALIENLHRDMGVKRDQLRHAKDKLFTSLIGMDNIQAEKFAMKEVEQIQHEIQLLELNHFKSIKALCNEDQKRKFDGIVYDIPKIFFPQHPKGKMPPPAETNSPVPPPPPSSGL